MRSTTKSAAAMAVAVGSIVVPNGGASAELYGGICNIDSDVPLTGFGGVGGTGSVRCNGTPDGVANFQGTVFLEWSPYTNGSWQTETSESFGVDLGVSYQRTPFVFGTRSGYYRTRTVVASPGGAWFEDVSSILKV